MTGFAGQMRAGGGAGRRGLWLTFLSPFGLEVAGGCGAEWIGIDVQHGDLELTDVAPLARVSPVPVLVRLSSHDEAQLARVLEGAVVSAIESVIGRTGGQGRITGIFTGNRELTRLLPAAGQGRSASQIETWEGSRAACTVLARSSWAASIALLIPPVTESVSSAPTPPCPSGGGVQALSRP
jgi:2-keto-3-deoxy-L-rhamnonate aldolase RhmA